MCRTLLLITNIILFFSSCGYNSSTYSPYLSKTKNIQFLVEQGKINWEKRVNTDEAYKSKLFLSKAYNLDPDNIEVAILYSRACHFIGHYFEKDRIKSDSTFSEGMDMAWDYVISTESFQQGSALSEGDDKEKIIAGIENISDDLIPLLYWWVENYSSYLMTKPVMERLENRDKIETALHKMLSIKPDFYYHGANRIFGELYSRLPGVDLIHAENNFQKSITGSPNYFATYVSRAEYFHTKNGDREKFIEDLQKVLNMDPTILPEVSPENLFEQEKAKILLSKEGSLFK